MKIFLISCFVFVRLALTSAWILYEKSSPPLSTSILFRRHASNIAPLNLPESQILRKERMGRLVPRNETPRLCFLKGTCNQVYYRNRSEFKKIFEATRTFRMSYDSLYPRKMKGRQVTQQPRERYYAGSSFIYMSPNLMIVRPVNVAHDWHPPKKPAYSGLREILFTKATQTQEPKPERLINKDQGLLPEFTEKSSTSKETSTTEENRAPLTEVSPQGAKTNSTSQNSFHEVQRILIQPYAVEEVVDENEPAAGDERTGLRGKPLFRANIKEDTNAGRRTSHNSPIVKIIPLDQGDKTTEKNVQNETANRYPTTTDHFLRIIPSQHSQELIQKPKERLVNRKEQSKNLKIETNLQQNSLGATAENGNRTNPISNSGVKNRENFRAVEITPSNGVGTRQQNATAETKYISVANLDEIRDSIQKANRKFSPSSLTENEFQGLKPQPTLVPKAGKQVATSKTGSTPKEVTFKGLDVENVTYVPDDFTITWKFQNNPSPTGKILNTTDQIPSGILTTPEGFTDHPSTSELLKPRTEVKDRESLSKNSRKMHFGQDSRSNELLEPVDQRRSDILISENFDDYFDDEYNLSYLEKLKRNNSLDALKNLTSASLIPLIPMVIQDLRQGRIPPEDISLLSSVFGDLWPTVLELSNSTNIDMLPVLKMKDESDLKNVLQSIHSYNVEPTTTETTLSLDYDSYDYMEKFKDLYEDLLNVGQELEVDEEKRLEKRVKGWKRSGTLSED